MDIITKKSLEAFAHQPLTADPRSKILLKLQGRTLVPVRQDQLGIWDKILKFLALFNIGDFSLSNIAEHLNGLEHDQNDSLYTLAMVKLSQKISHHNSRPLTRRVDVQKLENTIQTLFSNIVAPKLPDAIFNATNVEELDRIEAWILRNNDSSFCGAIEQKRHEILLYTPMTGLINLFNKAFSAGSLDELQVIENELQNVPQPRTPEVDNYISIIKDTIKQRQELLHKAAAEKEPAPAKQPIPAQDEPIPCEEPAPAKQSAPAKEAEKPGGGIVNGFNSCYLNAIVQSLRFVDLNKIFEKKETKPGARQELEQLHTVLKNRTVTAAEINHFRTLLRESWGFSQAGADTQEDAAEALTILFDALGVERFTYLEPVAGKEREIKGTILYAPIVPYTDVEQIVNGFVFLQAPEILPVQLGRFNDDGQKVQEGVFQNKSMKIRLIDGTQVAYELAAIVVHDGETIHRGHYVTYVPKPDSSWIEYNDAIVEGRPSEIEANAAHNGYLYFYRKKIPGSR